MRKFLFVSLIFVLSACQSGTPNVKEIDIYNSSADLIGTATLSEQGDSVQVKLKLKGLSTGFHGVHIHEFGNVKVQILRVLEIILILKEKTMGSCIPKALI